MGERMEATFGELTVRIERGRCIGSGNCVKVAEQIFELDDRGLVRFVAEPGEIEPGRLVEACDVCPVDALVVLTREGRQVVPRA